MASILNNASLMNFKKLRIIILVLSGLCLIGLVTVYLLRAPIKGFINEIRAERLQAQAEEAFAAEKWDQAARLGTAAHYLDRENKAIQRLVAEALLEQRSLGAVDWWLLVLDQPDLPVEKLRALTAALLRQRMIEEALPFMSRLVQLDPDNPETHRLWVQSLRLQYRQGQAATLLDEFAQRGTEDWSIHQAYMAMQRRSGEEDLQPVVAHLQRLLEEDGVLALNAARELVAMEAIDPALRAEAAAYLEANAEDVVDRLFAASAQVTAPAPTDPEILPVLQELLADLNEQTLRDLVNWVRWTESGEWFLDTVDWETYRDMGGAPDAYLQLLLDEARYARILQITENLSTEDQERTAAFLYYRSVALQATGQPDRALQALELAVQTVDPQYAFTLERYLARDGNWELLSRLYDILLENDPGNPFFLMKALGARYYEGDQDALEPILARVELEDFETQPDIQGFLLYIQLLTEGYSVETHQAIEGRLRKYPELFDFRLILGVSYVLQGQPQLAQEMLDGMPELGLNAPRYMRVAAVISGMPRDGLLALNEFDTLLPRERFLISRRQPGQSTP